MKIAIFGATGSVGVRIVEQSLEEGHQVTAFVRTPSKLKIEHPELRVVQGDVLKDINKIENALGGQDVVVVALGAGARGGVRSVGTRNIIAAMKRCGVRRLVCQSTLGAGNSFEQLNFKWRLLFRLPLRKAMADHEQQEKYVRDSGLDWTIVRPAAFTDGPMTGEYQYGESLSKENVSLSISRADVAHFIVTHIRRNEYFSEHISLSYANA